MWSRPTPTPRQTFGHLHSQAWRGVARSGYSWVMFADIITGEHGAADVLFLIAFILFVIAAVRAILVPTRDWTTLLIASGLAAVALGWLVL